MLDFLIGSAIGLVFITFMVLGTAAIITGTDSHGRMRLPRLFHRKPPKFCTYCGSMLLPVKDKTTYDPKDGSPSYRAYLKCPKYGDDVGSGVIGIWLRSSHYSGDEYSWTVKGRNPDE